MLTDKEKEEGERGLRTIFALILLPVDMVFQTFVFRCFWGWFFVPHGLPVLSLLNIFGCVLFMRMITQSRSYDGSAIPNTFGKIAFPISVTATSLLSGFITHWFMG